MTTLLEKALENIASQILASLADEAAWKKNFTNTRDPLRQFRPEALEEDQRGQTRLLDDLLD